MRKQTRSQFVLEISRVLSLAGSLALAGYLGAFIAGEHAAWAKGGGGGGGGSGSAGGNGGSGGNGSGSGGIGAGVGAGVGTGGTGVGAGVGVGTGGTGVGVGVGIGTGSTGSGTGAASSSGGTGLAAGGSQSGSSTGSTGSSTSGAQAGNPGAPDPGDVGVGRETATREQEGLFTRLLRTIGLARSESVSPSSVVSASATLSGPSGATLPGAPHHLVAASAPKLQEQTQAFRFEVGTAVFPTTGGVFTTEGVDGVDVVTVDARHHRVIHPAAFFEPHEGAKYDRRAVESFWPIDVGTRVRFLESLGTARWEHVMSALRVETVSVPAGVFRAFVVEHTVQPLGQGPQPAATYTYWYSPDAGAIVKSQFRPGDGKPPVTDEADVLGYPLTRPSTASTGVLE